MISLLTYQVTPSTSFPGDPLRLGVFAVNFRSNLTLSRKAAKDPQGYLPLPPPGAPVRGAPPNPGAALWFELDFAALLESVWPVMTISPSTRLPSTISVAAPSVRPILIRRRCGLPSCPITQTARV